MISPIFFGAKSKKKPFPQVNFIHSGNEVNFFSRTNYNLFLSTKEIQFVSLGLLFDKSNEPENLPTNQSFSNTTNELIFSPEVCFQCAEGKLGCPLLVKDTAVDKYENLKNLEQKWWKLKSGFEINSLVDCPFFQNLLNLTETPAERKFLELYLKQTVMHFLNDLGFAMSESSGFMDYYGKNKNFLEELLASTPWDRVPGNDGWGRNRKGFPLALSMVLPELINNPNSEAGVEIDASYEAKFLIGEAVNIPLTKYSLGTANNLTTIEIYELFKWLKRRLYERPALIPQVWIRHIYDSGINPANDPLKGEDYSRIDFAVFWNGKKIAIEIDGPEHYAKYQKQTKEWKISDEIYTKNLIRERNLKSEGWQFVRISNKEVQEADSLIDLISQTGLDKLLYVPDKEKLDNYPNLFTYF